MIFDPWRNALSRRRFHAGFTLASVVIGAALAMAAMMAAALTLLPAEADTSENAGPTTISATPSTSATPPPVLGARAADPTTSRINKSATRVAPAVNAGDCVEFGALAQLEKAVCGSGNSRYRVVETAAENHCPTDVDHVHPATRPGTEHDSLCLDIDWAVGGCMELGGDSPQHIDCHATGTTQAVRVLAIKPSTTDVTQCPGNTGFVYDQRRIVVCVAHL